MKFFTLVGKDSKRFRESIIKFVDEESLIEFYLGSHWVESTEGVFVVKKEI